METVVSGAWLGAGLLLSAGVAKLVRPSTTDEVLRLAGLPRGTARVRLLGLAEVLLAVTVFVFGGVAIAVQAIVYAAFTVFVVRQLGQPSASCGCFGAEDVPITPLHAAVDLALAVSALAALTTSAPSLASSLDEPMGWLHLGLVAVATVAVRALLVDLPRLADALRADRAHA